MFNGADKRNEQTSSIEILGLENVKLTARQQLFVEAYLSNNCNAAEAIRKVGYKGKNPYVAASCMLRNPNVTEYLRFRKEQELEKAGVNAYKVLTELAAIAFIDIRELYNPDGTLKKICELPRHIAAAIEGIECDEIFDHMTGVVLGHTKKVKFNSKLRALELLMKYTGLLDNRDDKDKANFNSIIVTLNLGGETQTLNLSNG